MTALHAPGTLVRARGRDWVVLPESDEHLVRIRPIGGTEDETTAILTSLEPLSPASFDPPDPYQAGDHASARLLRDAMRLGFRSSAGPFRSFGSLSVDPRPYQLVPLLMALRLETVRLLIADDVGIGKTIEAGLVTKELLENGTVSRFAVLCPPHLAEQWRDELSDKFHLDAELVLSGTAKRLERRYCAANESIFEVLPFTIVSTDFIKSDSRRDEFIRTAPELLIVDEAHSCAADPNSTTRKHQRHQLLRSLAASPDRHLVLVTATPHSGNTNAFRSLIGLLNPAFEGLPDDERVPEKTRRELALHFVQRRREDIRRDFAGEDSSFPARFDLPEEQGRYQLSDEYRALMRDAVTWAQETVRDPSGGRHRQRIRYWAALGLLRSLASSPRAAELTLTSRAVAADATSESEADAAGRRIVLDQDETEDEGRLDTAPGAQLADGDAPAPSSARMLRVMARTAQELVGPELDAKLAHATQLTEQLVDDGYNPILFCRYIATAHYVAEHLAVRLKDSEVAAVTGELQPEERERRIHELHEHESRVLVATDCLSEGINLQALFDAVVHYDLPWNPTRLEQREGRVDRFGQSSPQVRVATIYGTNNGIDEAVLNVLLRKHKEIRDLLGVSIPVPGSNDEFIESVFDSLFESEQLSLDLFGASASAPTQDALFAEWDAAADREKAARTRYAQYAIKVHEVNAQIVAAREAIGEATDVRRFMLAATGLLGGVATQHSDGSTTFRYAEASSALRDMLDVAGQGNEVRAVFDYPVRAGQVLLSRTHPFVETVATYLLDNALDPEAGNEPKAARCGAIRTSAVTSATTILLARYRFDVAIRRRGAGEHRQLAEEVAVHAFNGMPASPTWIDDDRVEELLTSQPTGNIGADQRTQFLERILEDASTIAGHLSAKADDKASLLEESHNNVRTESNATGRARVTAHQPVDLLGVYLLLPE